MATLHASGADPCTRPRSEEPAAAAAPAATDAAPTAAASASSAAASAPSEEAAAPSAEEAKATLIAELEKRKARAARFGQSTEEIDAQIERAQKFGVEDAAQDKGMAGLQKELGKGSRKGVDAQGAKKAVEGANKQRDAPGAKAPTGPKAEAKQAEAKKTETVSSRSVLRVRKAGCGVLSSCSVRRGDEARGTVVFCAHAAC